MNLITRSILLATLGSCSVSVLAEEQKTDEDLSNLEVVVVTGSARNSKERTKFETAYAITSLDAEQIDELAPIGITDLISSVPGFFAEGSGGVSGGNVWTRGIPIAAGYRFSPLLEDGLPVIADGDIPFTNPDVLLRLDETVTGVEVVRGGPGSIYYSNAAGGAINVISKKGGDEFEGLFKFTVGDYGLKRGDFYASGPINENLSYFVGGFYRVDDGIRDAGFVGNEGGQIKASLTYSDDDFDFTIRHKVLDDRNIFYLPIPIKFVNGEAKALEGVDPNYGTIVSNDFRLMQFEDMNGKFTADLQDGIHPVISSTGIEFNADLDNEWQLALLANYTSGTNDMNSIFSIFDPESASDYVAAQLARAKEVDPNVASIVPTFVSSGDVFDINNENGNGFLQRSGWLAIDTELRNFQIDIQLSKSFEEHELTIGTYFSHLDFDQKWHWDTFLHETRNAPRAVDLIAKDAAGNVIPEVQLTRSGITDAGFLPKDGTTTMQSTAFFISDTWQVTDEVRLDAGIRYQNNDYKGLTGNVIGSLFGAPTGRHDLDGDPKTFYDQGAYVDGTFNVLNQSKDGITWTLGANWELNDNLALFARYTDSDIMPDMRAAYDNNIDANGNLTVPKVKQIEFGAKVRYAFDHSRFNLFAAFYANEFNPFVFPVTDATFGASAVEIDTKSNGFEWELGYQLVDTGFGFDLSGMIQVPQFSSGGIGLPASVDPDGNQIQRTPKLMYTFKPYYNFETDSFKSAKVYASMNHVGKRYQDVANNTELPEYTYFNLGASIEVSDSTSLNLVATNINNEIGLQEGNPRTSSIVGQAGAEVVQARPIFGRTIKLSLTTKF
jgi:outer membrane receptor protein involved in Fe transport